MSTFLDNVGSKGVATLFVLLAVFSGVFYYANVREQKNQVNCQSQYNEAFARSLEIRSKAATDRQNAVDDVIKGVGKLIATPPKTPAELERNQQEYIRLFSTFDKASKANEATRAANPLPKIPDC